MRATMLGIVGGLSVMLCVANTGSAMADEALSGDKIKGDHADRAAGADS